MSKATSVSTSTSTPTPQVEINPTTFIQENQGLFYQLAEYRHSDQEDAIQELYEELLKAIDSFRPKRGIKFTTYFYNTAMNRIWKHNRKQMAAKRKEDNSLFCLDTPVPNKKDQVNTTYGDLVEDKSMATEASDFLLIKDIEIICGNDRLSRQCLVLLASGEKVSEVSRRLGIRVDQVKTICVKFGKVYFNR